MGERAVAEAVEGPALQAVEVVEAGEGLARSRVLYSKISSVRRRDGSEFHDKVRARGSTPYSEQRLRKQVRRLKELRAADVEEIAQLKADVEALVGALHQATAENQLLRQQLTDR
ncbi:hypothetical protein [Streptomyces luteolifulvus]|uniref:hypothetical protein n=1 Tax=Streptomyces luteolifulvus TaxID=2615112 RepID=UPI00177FD905|nr:hypothetical protein [Streptomyces luteolifulvus]